MGAFGTAATGTAIGTLSGAAATVATASWLGRAVIAGAAGLGIRVAPAALGGIGLLARLPVQGMIGAVIAGKNERGKINQVDTAVRAMNRYDSNIDHYMTEMKLLLQDTQQESSNLIRSASKLSAMMEAHGADSELSKAAAETLLQQMTQVQGTCKQFQDLQSEMHKGMNPNEE